MMLMSSRYHFLQVVSNCETGSQLILCFPLQYTRWTGWKNPPIIAIHEAWAKCTIDSFYDIRLIMFRVLINSQCRIASYAKFTLLVHALYIHVAYILSLRVSNASRSLLGFGGKSTSDPPTHLTSRSFGNSRMHVSCTQCGISGCKFQSTSTPNQVTCSLSLSLVKWKSVRPLLWNESRVMCILSVWQLGLGRGAQGFLAII